MTIIQIRNLGYEYSSGSKKTIPVLFNINLNINAGEMVAIQGKSGSGKSTLLYLLGGTLNIQKGEIIIANKSLAKLDNKQMAHFRQSILGFVFQQFHLLPNTSVTDNVLLPLEYNPCYNLKELQKVRNSTLETTLNALGISDVATHHPNQLSGGQQQRTAIARALINNPQIILADEPTGNLDSKNSKEIIEIFKKLKQKGKTIVIVTHDAEVAKECDRIYNIHDGVITEEIINNINNNISNHNNNHNINHDTNYNTNYNNKIKQGHKPLFSSVKNNLKQNKIRTLLTMIGITIGVASMISMVTLGLFTKEKLLESFSELGVNVINIRGYRNWELKATDVTPVMFESFNYEKDLLPLKKIFPEIMAITPSLYDWDSSVSYGASYIENDVRVNGISEEGITILQNRDLLKGKFFNIFHVADKSAVCVIGYDINKNLFKKDESLGKVIAIKGGRSNSSFYNCKVIGVFKETSSNKDWLKPNNHIYIPFTFFMARAKNFWEVRISEFLIKSHTGVDIELLGKKIEVFFKKKYGISGKYYIGTDAEMITQMDKSLTLFTIILTFLAAICLGVGGVGVANMMMVSVAERYREIGIRKAVGATNYSIRMLFLTESIIICLIAGIIGLIIGVFSYEAIIFVAAKFINKIKFEWVVNYLALTLSVLSIIVVGLLSGIIPAIKAEKLQIIEALRAE